MWRDVGPEELDSLGSEDGFALELILTFQEDVDPVMFLTRQRVRVRGDVRLCRVVDQVAIERLALKQPEN